MEILKKLQGKLQEQLDKLSPEDHEQWMAHSCTKALLAGMAVDTQDLMEQWGTGQFANSENENHNAIGQVLSLDYQVAAIHAMVSRDD